MTDALARAAEDPGRMPTTTPEREAWRICIESLVTPEQPRRVIEQLIDHVERLEKELERSEASLCRVLYVATDGRMSKPNYDLPAMTALIEDTFTEKCRKERAALSAPAEEPWGYFVPRWDVHLERMFFRLEDAEEYLRKVHCTCCFDTIVPLYRHPLYARARQPEAGGKVSSGCPDCEESRHHVEALRRERDELQATLDLVWDANQRGIKVWQEATGRDMVWPDQAEMVTWLLAQLSARRDAEGEAKP